jgi:hypothetical protein
VSIRLAHLFRSRRMGWIILALSSTIYLAYVGFIIQRNQAPVDYETFMQIGQRFWNGETFYGENSYYPLPYVMIFGVFSQLPRPISMTIWMLGPVVVALIATEWRPFALWFAPIFSHFVGGPDCRLWAAWPMALSPPAFQKRYVRGCRISFNPPQTPTGHCSLFVGFFRMGKMDKRKSKNSLSGMGLSFYNITFISSRIFYRSRLGIAMAFYPSPSL